MELLISQLHTFSIMLGFGFLLGVFYDLYRSFIRKIRPGQFWLSIADLVLPLVMGLGGFALLLYANWGEMRFYIILSLIIGFLLYFYLIKLIRTGNN